MHDVIVIGAGQAGLAVGYQLTRRNARFLILDSGPEVGHIWRSRWDSLRLFTPAEYDSLPGLPFPAPAGSYPTKDQVADYLCEYVNRFGLPVRTNSHVKQVRRIAQGFTVTTDNDSLGARQIVIATGPFQVPFVPAIATGLNPTIPQLHSAAYRNPKQIRSGRVLVVGAANSGLQIADDLVATHEVTVAVGSRPPQLPQRFLGRDLFFWLTKSRVMGLPAESRLAQRIVQRGDAVIGSRTRTLRARGVEFRARLTGLTGRVAQFADGMTTDVDAVVWATGYRPDYSWLDIPGVVRDGKVQHRAGATDVRGLYFVGLQWQTTRGSALLGFVKDDARAIADKFDVYPRLMALAGQTEAASRPVPLNGSESARTSDKEYQ